MYKIISRLDKHPYIKETNISFLRKYKKYISITIVGPGKMYITPLIEIFYQQIDFSYCKSGNFYKPLDFECTKIPLNYINNKIRKRSLFLSKIQFKRKLRIYYKKIRSQLKNI